LCSRRKAMLLLFVRNRKAERGTHRTRWVASCGHEKILRRQNFTRGRFLLRIVSLFFVRDLMYFHCQSTLSESKRFEVYKIGRACRQTGAQKNHLRRQMIF